MPFDEHTPEYPGGDDNHRKAARLLSISLLSFLVKATEKNKVCFACTLDDMLPRLFALYVSECLALGKKNGFSSDEAIDRAVKELRDKTPHVIDEAKEMVIEAEKLTRKK